MMPLCDAAVPDSTPAVESPGALTRTRLSSAAVGWIALAVGYVVALALAVQHLFYGVDLQDETYYLALAYRFAKGAKPLVSEVSLHQFAALLEAPLVKAYIGIVGSTDGIVLAARITYVGVLLITIAATVCALRRLIGWQWAAAVCLPLVFYAPMAISGLSYNSIATLAFLACCTWGLASVLESGTATGAAVCGVLAAVVVVAYPPWAIAVVPTLAIYGVLLWRRGARWHVLLLGVGPAVVLALGAALILTAGVETVIATLRMNLLGRFKFGFAGQLASIGRSVGIIVSDWPMPLLLAVAAVALRRRVPFVSRLLPALMVLSLVALAVLLPWLISWTLASTFVWYLAGLSFVLYLGVRDHPDAGTVLLTLCVPGLIAGLVVSFSSMVGEGVAGQGLLPAMLASSVFVLWLVGVDGPLDSGSASSVVAAVAYVVLLVVSMWFLQSIVVFHDVPPRLATARVVSGPWRGLLTSTERRDFVDGLSEDFTDLGTKDKRILILSGIPGAYLAAQGTITMPTPWLPYSGSARADMVAEQRKVAPPDFIVIDTHFVPPPPDDPFTAYARDNGFVTVKSRDWYQILERR